MGSRLTEFNREYFTNLVASEDFYRDQQENRVQKILELLRAVGNKDAVADLGCFTGLTAVKYLDFGVKRVDGFDLVPEALRIAEARGIHTMVWRMGEEKAPVEDERYDAVIAGEIIEHVLDTDFFIAEIRRILKPGGHLILSTVNLSFWASRIVMLLGKSPWTMPGVSFKLRYDKRLALEHIRIGNLPEWKYFLESNSFQVLRIVTAPPFSKKGITNRLLLCVDTILTHIPALGYSIVFLARK